MLPRVALLLGLLIGFAPHGRADQSLLLGPDPDLVAGAEALLSGRFEEGVSLTQTGLNHVVTSEQRTAGLTNLCAGYTALRRYELAVVHCTEALTLDPQRWQAYSNRALAYLGQGRVRLARLDVIRGIELAPKAQRLLQVAALVEEAAGKPADGPERDSMT